MNLTQLSQKIATLTLQFQQMLNLAKRVEELPVQQTLEPSSKIHVSNNGVSQSVQVQQIIDAVASFNFDRLISVGDITILDGLLTVPAGAQWIITGINYFNSVPAEFQIPFASGGMTRIDLIYADADGQILRRAGLEGNTIWREPDVLPNTVKVTSFTVTDSSIGSPDEPITGSTSVSKESQGIYNELGTGIVQLTFQNNGANKYLVRNATRVDGFKFAITPEQQQSGWAGKPFYITNKTSGDLPLTRNKTGIIKLLWPTEGDMILPKDATAMFYYAQEMHYVGPEFSRAKKYILVTGNTSVTNEWNGAIVKVKANSTITFPAGLIQGLEFDYLTFTGAIATLSPGAGVALNSPNGLILQEKKMGTVLYDTTNTYEVRGEQTTS